MIWSSFAHGSFSWVLSFSKSNVPTVKLSKRCWSIWHGVTLAYLTKVCFNDHKYCSSTASKFVFSVLLTLLEIFHAPLSFDCVLQFDAFEFTSFVTFVNMVSNAPGFAGATNDHVRLSIISQYFAGETTMHK